MMDALRDLALESYERFVGLELPDVWRWTAALQRLGMWRREGWQKPGGQGQRRHQTLHGGGRSRYPLGQRHCSGQSSHDSPLLVETLDAVAQTLGGLPEATNIHLDRAYDSEATRQRLRERARSECSEISLRRASLPRSSGHQAVGRRERTSSWHRAPTRRSLCGARRGEEG
jgi:hypothetical protein